MGKFLVDTALGRHRFGTLKQSFLWPQNWWAYPLCYTAKPPIPSHPYFSSLHTHTHTASRIYQSQIIIHCSLYIQATLSPSALFLLLQTPFLSPLIHHSKHWSSFWVHLKVLSSLTPVLTPSPTDMWIPGVLYFSVSAFIIEHIPRYYFWFGVSTHGDLKDKGMSLI